MSIKLPSEKLISNHLFAFDLTCSFKLPSSRSWLVILEYRTIEKNLPKFQSGQTAVKCYGHDPVPPAELQGEAEGQHKEGGGQKVSVQTAGGQQQQGEKAVQEDEKGQEEEDRLQKEEAGKEAGTLVGPFLRRAGHSRSRFLRRFRSHLARSLSKVKNELGPT